MKPYPFLINLSRPRNWAGRVEAHRRSRCDPWVGVCQLTHPTWNYELNAPCRRKAAIVKVCMPPQQRSEYLGRLLLSYGAFLLRINIHTVYAYVKAKLGQKLRASILFLFSLTWHSNRPAEGCVDAERRQHPDRPRRPRTVSWRSRSGSGLGVVHF